MVSPSLTPPLHTSRLHTTTTSSSLFRSRPGHVDTRHLQTFALSATGRPKGRWGPGATHTNPVSAGPAPIRAGSAKRLACVFSLTRASGGDAEVTLLSAETFVLVLGLDICMYACTVGVTVVSAELVGSCYVMRCAIRRRQDGGAAASRF